MNEKRTKLIFIRHGQSIGNALHMLLGHTDLDLSELGFTQARTTAEYLKNERIDAIYSSDLKRAMSTAEPHAALRGITVTPDKQLRETYLGEWENMTVDEVIEKYGEKVYRVDWTENFGSFTFPSGESVWGSGERFKKETERLAKEHEGKTLLIVAHGAVIRAFFANIMGYTPEECSTKTLFPTNASYSVAYYENGRFLVESYSNDEYLSEVGITKINW